MQLAMFCGSTGERSANQKLLDAMADIAVGRGHAIQRTVALAEIPGFRAELVDAAPPPVTRLRRQFEQSDGVVVAVPEYGGGAAGWAKNALDWMVGSGSLYQRTTAVVSAGTTGGRHAIEQVARTLTWQGAFVVATLGVASPRVKADAEGRLTDRSTLDAISVVVDRLETANGSAEMRTGLAVETVSALGIDLFDRRPQQ